MAGVPALPLLPARSPDTARCGRLVHLLAISLLLHLALLAWPFGGNTVAGQRASATHGTQLSATLTARAVTPDGAASAPATARHEVPPRDAARRSTTQPTALDDASDVTSPAPVSPSEIPSTSPPAPDGPMTSVATPYYPSDQLTTRPQALAEPQLDAPPLADIVASGEIALTLWIDEHGSVAELRVEHSDLPDVFAQTAAAAFREVRFAPGEIDGHAVGSVLRIAVRYDDERLAGEHTAPRAPALEPAS